MIKELNEAAICLGKPLKVEVIEHSALKFCNYLQTTHKWVDFTELDNFFMLLTQGDLGQIYNLAFTHICNHFKLYIDLRKEKNKFHVQKTELLIAQNNQDLITGGFEKHFKNDPSIALRCPRFYGMFIAKLQKYNNESIDSYDKRALNHFKDNYL